MKRFIVLFLLSLSTFITIAAQSDSLFVYYPQIPVLIERKDNPVCYFRFRSNVAGQKLNHLTLHLSGTLPISSIKALKLYYGGTDCDQVRGSRVFYPVPYISRDQAGQTLEANSSYSAKVKELCLNKNRTVDLTTDFPLVQGLNYFWLSAELKPQVSLLSTFKIKLSDVAIGKQPVTLVSIPSQSPLMRLGVGVRHAGDNHIAAFRIPGLATSNKGTLLATYDMRHNNSTDLQEYITIGLSRSLDKGKTWQPMQTIIDMTKGDCLPKAQNGVGDPAVLVDRQTGTIWVIAVWYRGLGVKRAWGNALQGNAALSASQVVLVKSVDDGRTWSKPINVNASLKDSSWFLAMQGPGKGITMADGTLVFAGQYVDANQMPYSCLIYSKDHGATWHISKGARSNTTESQVVEVSPGTLMLNMRDNRGGSRAVAITKDLGNTWQEHASSRKALQEPVCMASLIRIRATDNTLGKDILLFSNPNSTKDRNHITIKASLDNGMTWLSENQLLLDEGEGWGYSCLTQVDRETIGILYESSAAHMTFQRIKLSDLIRTK